ncbi:putative cytochrome P450 monooxygenase [Phlegmacium glaucopus]|nr:putative cytochrome P450 monooxygenase [Phlegmacium glaucopus]
MGYILINGALLAFAVVALKLWRFGRREHCLPPGPPTKPFLGNIHLFPPAFPQVQFSQWAKDYGDVFSIKLLNSTMVIISSPSAMKAFLDKRGSTTGGRPLSHNSLAAGGFHMALESMDTGVWKRGRKAIHTFLTPEAIEGYLPKQQAEYIQLLHDLLLQPDDLYTHVKRATASSMTTLLYGQRYPTYKGSVPETYFEGIKLFNEICDVSAYPPIELFPWVQYIPRWLAPWTKHCDHAKAVRRNLYFSLFEECERNLDAGNTTGSYIEKVLMNQEELGMTRDEIAWLGGVLMDAGGETTASTMQSFILSLLAYPKCQRRAQEEIDSVIGPDRMPTLADYENLPYVRALVSESHRFRPLLPIGLPHLVTEDTPYKNYVVPKGSVSFLNIWGIFHDPDYFEDPDSFRPERYLGSEFGTKPGADISDFRNNILFGAGRRICPGENMGSKTVAFNAMNLLWAFELAPASPQFSTMNLDNYAKPGLEMAPLPFKCKVKLRHAEKGHMIKAAYEAIVSDL